MPFKYIMLLLIIIVKFFNSNEYLDTDCYKAAGSSVDQCRLFTTFINGTEDNFYIEPNQLYLCCYVSDKINGSDYKGCLPIKEEVYFSKNKEFNFQCFSNFIAIKNILIIFILINIIF